MIDVIELARDCGATHDDGFGFGGEQVRSESVTFSKDALEAFAAEIRNEQAAKIAMLNRTVNILHVALMDMSPCAYSECQQSQHEEYEIAMKVCADALSATSADTSKFIAEIEAKILREGVVYEQRGNLGIDLYSLPMQQKRERND